MKGKATLLLAGPLLASCVPAISARPLPAPALAARQTQPRPQPTSPLPSPLRVTQQIQRTTPAAAQPSFAWADAPLTPGRWTYGRAGSGRPTARYGSGDQAFQVECAAPGRIALSRNGGGSSLTVRTSSTQRAVTGLSGGGRVVVQLPAADPLLDAMAFSRGRFAVQSADGPPLVIPAWPELARVVEDCRR